MRGEGSARGRGRLIGEKSICLQYTRRLEPFVLRCVCRLMRCPDLQTMRPERGLPNGYDTERDG